MQNSIHSLKEIQTFWIKFQKMLLVGHLSFLHAKQLLMKLLFENQQTFANLLLRLTLANYTPTRCVNPCQPVFIRVEISIQKRVVSYLDKTRVAALKIWWCLSSNEQDQNVKLKASLKQADRRKLTSSVLMGFVLIATLCLMPWVAFTTSVPVKSCVPLSLIKIFDVVQKEKARCIETILYTRESLQGYWNVGLRMVETVQNNQYCLTTYPRTLSFQAFTCSCATFRRDKEGKVIWLRAVRYWSTWKFELKIW